MMPSRPSLAFLAAALLLGGCNSNEPRPDPQPTPGVPTVTQPPRPLPLHPAAVPNPSVIIFEKMSITVDEPGRFQIAQLIERARIAQRITITGYCDRRQIANPTDAAIARAVAVRDALIALGIPHRNMAVTINIGVPQKHAAEIRFD